MKKKIIPRLSLAIWLIGLLVSCQRMTDEEELVTNTPKTLNIKARSSDNAEIKYPLYLYAFNENGNCVAVQIVEQAGEGLRLELAGGRYKIVAISDVAGGYVLPEQPNVQSKIVLNGVSGATTPLMTGNADVTVSSKETSLNITLSYAVTAVSVALKDVPSDVSAVKLILSPFYSSLSLNGDYGDDGCSLEIPCSLDTESIWSSKTIYAFPGNGNKTVFSIQLTRKDETQITYAYTYQGAPEANRPFNVSGNYAGSVTVGGEFIAKGWDSPIDVEFDFGGLDSSDGSSEDGGDEKEDETSTAPSIGKIWSDGIVVQAEDGDVLLMSLSEWECYTSGLEELLEEYATDGWQLPDASQAKLLNETFQDESLTDLNELLEEYGYTTINVDKRYLYDNSGSIYAFGFKSTSKFLAAGTQTKYRIRFVKIISNAA